MKTPDIQFGICKSEILKGNTPCENVGFYFAGECDVLSINKNGLLHEFEVKVSRSDFFADLKKQKWVFFEHRIAKSIPNYFSYVCPAPLISIDEIPDWAGLIYAANGKLEVVKRPKSLHKERHDKERLLKTFARILAERRYLGSCLLTYLNKKRKERTDEIRERYGVEAR